MSNEAKPPQRAFDFTRHMRRLCGVLVSGLPELGHINIDRVLVGYSQARRGTAYGLQASLTPMRFKDGRVAEIRDGQQWEVERFFDDSGREYLYILTFYLPRFLNQPFEEKLTTVLHELWHISPQFNGDLRRHPGARYVHGRSQQAYDDAMRILARRWLASSPPRDIYRFLEFSFAELRRQYGQVYGVRIPRPKMIRTRVK